MTTPIFFIKCAALVAALIFIYGGLAPPLISASSTFLVVVGFILTVIVGPLIIYYTIQHMVNSEEKTSEGI